MFQDWLTGHGPGKPRWGLKWLEMCSSRETVEQFESLWPQSCWIVCLRNPFVSVSSQQNTCVPGQDLREYALRWVRTCMFVESHDSRRVVAVQIDKLSEETESRRQAAMERVLACAGEAPSAETEAFVKRWPRVHKVRAD